MIATCFKRYPRYNKRDLMVEGSGFLQWLSVLALATDPQIDVLRLDEPDAHLHPTLQEQLLASLHNVADNTDKQILIATHSTEILRNAELTQILDIRSGKPDRYLSADKQRAALLAGLGSDYAPRIDRAKRTSACCSSKG